MKPRDLPILGEAVREMRTALGMTAPDVCRRDAAAGYDPCLTKETISRIENRTDYEMSNLLIFRLSKAMGVPPGVIHLLYENTVLGTSYPIDLEPVEQEVIELVATILDARNKLKNTLRLYRPEG